MPLRHRPDVAYLEVLPTEKLIKAGYETVGTHSVASTA